MIELLPLLLALASPVQDTDICTTRGACRHVGTVRIEGPDGKGADIPVNRDMPWVVQDNVMLFVGESVTITLIERNGELVPQLVRAGAESAATKPGPGEIRFSLGEFAKGSIMLIVESNHSRTLDYAALMVTPKGPERTSVCSLRPGIAVYESWRAPIVQLALWHFVPAEEPGCKTLKWGQGLKE